MKLEIGKNYYVRTASDHWIGRLVEVGPFTMTLEDAAWIADSGRLSTFMKEGTAPNMEIELVGTVMVQSGPAVLPWPHKLFDRTV